MTISIFSCSREPNSKIAADFHYNPRVAGEVEFPSIDGEER